VRGPPLGKFVSLSLDATTAGARAPLRDRDRSSFPALAKAEANRGLPGIVARCAFALDIANLLVCYVFYYTRRVPYKGIKIKDTRFGE